MRTVISPGGDRVQVMPDTKWEDVGRGALNAAWVSRQPILGALWLNGHYSASNGTAIALLHDAAIGLGYTAMTGGAINAALSNPAMALSVVRETRGKRTYDVRLERLPLTWYERLIDTYGEAPDEPETVAVVDHIPDPVDEVAATNGHTADAIEIVEFTGAPDWEPAPLELNIAAVVAMQLLTRVVEIVSTGAAPSHQEAEQLAQAQGDLREVEHLLSLRLDENRSLRRKLGEAGDEIGALKLERDGLRQRLRIAEHNLKVAGNVDTQRLVTEQVRAELAKIMQAKPGSERAMADDPR